jgi:LRP1 type putative zinc finger protein
MTSASAKGGLPPEVRAQALFKCVRLMGVEDGENEFAYQATVKIGGHIFKGVLYDQGVDNGQPAAQSLGELQLGGSRGGMPSSSALIDPASLYVSGSALLGGKPSTDFTIVRNSSLNYQCNLFVVFLAQMRTECYPDLFPFTMSSVLGNIVN